MQNAYDIRTQAKAIMRGLQAKGKVDSNEKSAL